MEKRVDRSYGEHEVPAQQLPVDFPSTTHQEPHAMHPAAGGAGGGGTGCAAGGGVHVGCAGGGRAGGDGGVCVGSTDGGFWGTGWAAGGGTPPPPPPPALIVTSEHVQNSSGHGAPAPQVGMSVGQLLHAAGYL